jgi:hypothetical protein
VYLNNIYFDLSIGNYSNFLSEGDLFLFSITYTAGLALPTFKVSFRTTNSKIRDAAIENNTMTFTIGQTDTDTDTYIADILTTDKNNDTMGQFYTVDITGVSAGLGYFLHNVETKAYTGTSLDVFETVCGKTFKDMISTINKVNDKSSNWYQRREPLNTFLANVWMHMDIRPNVPLTAINPNRTVILKDLDSIKGKAPSYIFTPSKAEGGQQIQYMNNPTPEVHKLASNLFAGFGRMSNILAVDSGRFRVSFAEAIPEIAATQVSEKLDLGVKVSDGFVNSVNTHETYAQTFLYNTAKLMSLSGVMVELDCPGYYRNLNPLDWVELQVQDTTDHSIEGNYLLNTIQIYATPKTGVQSKFYLFRDNLNDVENSVQDNKKQKVLITPQQKEKLLQYMRNLRLGISLFKQAIDGTLFKEFESYITNLKYGALTSFSLFGATVNLNSATELMDSLKSVGNGLMNQLINAFIPSPYSNILQNFALKNTTLASLFAELVADYVPVELQDLLLEIQSLLVSSVQEVQTIQNQNIQVMNVDTASTTYSNDGTTIKVIDSNEGTETEINTEPSNKVDNTQKVDNIISDFQDNTQGIDIPFPNISLDETQSLFTDEELKDFIANQVIDELDIKGYLADIDNDVFKNILIGVTPISFSIIDQVNANAGTNYYVRYWGNYSSLIELTDFYIRKSYKDKYRTAPVTKIISATKGSNMYIAFPQTEKNLKFYINSTKITLPYMEMDLGYVAPSGNPLLYNVYYTTEGYNSNSNILEVRKS